MRTFVAVEVSNKETVQNMIEFQKTLIQTGLKAKPVSSNQLHFTLMFLGEINEAMLQSIKEKLADIRFEPIDVTYTGIGVFPSNKFVRVIWIGVDSDSGSKLINLAKQVETRLNTLGFRSDKPFTPHITLFRVNGKIDLNAIMNFKNKTFGIDRLSTVKVKKSELTLSGPIYSDLFAVGGN
jgi:2'-5' RNA ligase